MPTASYLYEGIQDTLPGESTFLRCSPVPDLPQTWRTYLVLGRRKRGGNINRDRFPFLGDTFVLSHLGSKMNVSRPLSD